MLYTDRDAALIDMAYQMGQGGLASFTNLQAAVQNQNWDRAAREIVDSRYYRDQTPNRAARNAIIMSGGSFSALLGK